MHAAMNKIVVVGGYGTVGRRICVILSGRHPGRVIAAGRSFDKAASLSRELGGAVEPLALDMNEPATALNVLPKDTGVLVMCLDQQDPAFSLACIQRGIHYADVTASADFHAALTTAAERESKLIGTGVLSVGLAPGLTNLLARSLLNEAPTPPRHIDIAIMLGLGEAHGPAAVAWTLENMSKPFAVLGESNPIEPMSEPRAFHIPGEASSRTAYRFNFAEQHSLPGMASGLSAQTRLCFDSRVVTKLIRIAGWLKVLRLLQIPLVRRAVTWLFMHLPFGSEAYALQAVAHSEGVTSGICTIVGESEAAGTAAVAAFVAAELGEGKVPKTGVYHIHDLFELGPVLEFAAAYAHLRLAR